MPGTRGTGYGVEYNGMIYYSNTAFVEYLLRDEARPVWDIFSHDPNYKPKMQDLENKDFCVLMTSDWAIDYLKDRSLILGHLEKDLQVKDHPLVQ